MEGRNGRGPRARRTPPAMRSIDLPHRSGASKRASRGDGLGHGFIFLRSFPLVDTPLRRSSSSDPMNGRNRAPFWEDRPRYARAGAMRWSRRTLRFPDGRRPSARRPAGQAVTMSHGAMSGPRPRRRADRAARGAGDDYGDAGRRRRARDGRDPGDRRRARGRGVRCGRPLGGDHRRRVREVRGRRRPGIERAPLREPAGPHHEGGRGGGARQGGGKSTMFDTGGRSVRHRPKTVAALPAVRRVRGSGTAGGSVMIGSCAASAPQGQSARTTTTPSRRSTGWTWRDCWDWFGPNAIAGFVGGSRPRSAAGSRSWSVRCVNCAERTRSCARRLRTSPRRSSTVARGDGTVHRRTSWPIRGRAALRRAADRPIDVLRAQGTRSAAVAQCGTGASRRVVVRGDSPGIRRALWGPWGAQGVAPACA